MNNNFIYVFVICGAIILLYCSSDKNSYYYIKTYKPKKFLSSALIKKNKLLNNPTNIKENPATSQCKF